jgi:hypothetical protein
MSVDIEEMRLLFHPESDCYIVANNQEEANKLQEGEPLLEDVTGDVDHHERATAYFKREHGNNQGITE